MELCTSGQTNSKDSNMDVLGHSWEVHLRNLGLFSKGVHKLVGKTYVSKIVGSTKR